MKKLNHVAFIPDGNRRWARKQSLLVFKGHRAGAKTIEQTLVSALKHDIANVTFWGCSVDNIIKRDREEVVFLFQLFEEYFKNLLHNKILYEREVRVRVLGLWKQYFPPELQRTIIDIEEATRHHTKANLTFLLAYSGTLEMIQAVQKIIAQNTSSEVTFETIKQNLYTYELPPVDLVIRTGGEPHLSSGFMMWDVTDAQLYFSEKLWPDFSEDELQKALDEYSQREQRRGK